MDKHNITLHYWNGTEINLFDVDGETECCLFEDVQLGKKLWFYSGRIEINLMFKKVDFVVLDGLVGITQEIVK